MRKGQTSTMKEIVPKHTVQLNLPFSWRNPGNRWIDKLAFGPVFELLRNGALCRCKRVLSVDKSCKNEVRLQRRVQLRTKDIILREQRTEWRDEMKRRRWLIGHDVSLGS